MTRKYRLFELSHLVLRLGIVLALFVTLKLPHPGMTAVVATPKMTVHHVDAMQGQMSHSAGVHDKMNGALCAMLCAGADRAEGLRHPPRFMQFVFARWTTDADPVWEPFQPDPAQRPPDATLDA